MMNKVNPLAHILVTIVAPLVMGVTAFLIYLTSNVSPNLVLARGNLAEVLLIIYTGLSLGMAVRPAGSFNPFAIPVYGAFTFLVTVGRGVGFASLLLEGQTSLWGAVAERFALTMLAGIWLFLWVEIDHIEERG